MLARRQLRARSTHVRRTFDADRSNRPRPAAVTTASPRVVGLCQHDDGDLSPSDCASILLALAARLCYGREPCERPDCAGAPPAQGRAASSGSAPMTPPWDPNPTRMRDGICPPHLLRASFSEPFVRRKGFLRPPALFRVRHVGAIRRTVPACWVWLRRVRFFPAASSPPLLLVCAGLPDRQPYVLLDMTIPTPATTHASPKLPYRQLGGRNGMLLFVGR